MADPITFALIHAPLVGPSTWSWIAAELEELGHRAIVPSLTDVERTTAVPFEFCAGAVLNAIQGLENLVLVGHSGAGMLLPFVGSRCSEFPTRLLFVDAGLPPMSGSMQLADSEFRAFLDTLVDPDGVLPPWSEWWGEGAMQSMVPDADRRATIEADVPRLPIRYYDHVTYVPTGWPQVPAAYLLLSEAYRDAAEDARSRGWPVRELHRKHLHMVVDPEAVAAVLVELARS